MPQKENLIDRAYALLSLNPGRGVGAMKAFAEQNRFDTDMEETIKQKTPDKSSHSAERISYSFDKNGNEILVWIARHQKTYSVEMFDFVNAKKLIASHDKEPIIQPMDEHALGARHHFKTCRPVAVANLEPSRS